MKKKHKYHYFQKIQSWIGNNNEPTNQQLLSSHEGHVTSDVVVDPITIINRNIYCEEKGLSSNNNYSVVEEQMLLAAKDLIRAYRFFFHDVVSGVQKEFRRLLRLEYNSENNGEQKDTIHHQDSSLQNFSSDKRSCCTGVVSHQEEEKWIVTGSEFHKIWYQPLNQAVKVGIPADFSKKYANQVYAAYLLEPRVRFLHHLVMDYNPISNRIRKLLLPTTTPTPTSSSSSDGVRICSIGGGPGYDHISFCIIAAFLQQIQSDDDDFDDAVVSYERKTVHTQIFDLFDNDWKRIMNLLESCVEPTISRITTEMNSSNNKYQERFSTNNVMIMHHCDVRLGIDDLENRDLHCMLPTADIICLQYVLHENSSSIFPTSMKKQLDAADKSSVRPIGGVVRDLLARAKVGAFMICTDSNNFVWPILKENAAFYGWTYLGDAEKKKGVSFGPTSFVILERHDKPNGVT